MQQKKQHDHHAQEQSFEEGEKVYVKNYGRYEEVSDEVQNPESVRGSAQDARPSPSLVNTPKTYPTRTRQPPDRLEL